MLRVGDVVKSIYKLSKITKGKTYVIINILGINRIEIINDIGISEWYFSFYFEKDYKATRDKVIDRILN